MTASPYARPPGEIVVDGYTLLAKIGEGGMGVVHLAQRPGGPRVALKVLRPHVVGGDEGRSRLAREVSSLSRVRSRRVAHIIDADPWGEIAYVATRYVPGPDLHDHVAEEGPMGGGDLRRFAAGLAEALRAVHAVGVLHRDIKPSNVLIEGRDPVLIDFGLARLADDDRLTQTGWLLGTPGYLAPEILHGDDPTTAADVHSWAATVAFAGLGRSPFGKGPAMAVMDRVRRGEHDLAGLPAPARRLLEPALHPDPLVRPTLAELADELDAPRPPATAPAPAVEVDEPPLTLPYAAVLRHDAREQADAETRADLTRPETVHGTERFDDGRFDDGRYDDDILPFAEPERSPYRTPPPIPDQHQPDPYHPGPYHPGPYHPGPYQPDLYEQPEGHGYADPHRPLEPERLPAAVRARTATLVATAGLTLGALAAAYPWPTLAGMVVGTWLARGFSAAGSAVQARRMVRGRRWYDVPRAGALLPWHLVATVPVTVLLLLWSVGFAGCAAIAAWVFGGSQVAAIGLGGFVLAVCLWTGPGGGRVRDPLRRMLTPVSSDATSWVVALCVVGGTAVLLVLLVAGQGTSWAPASQAPWAGWAEAVRSINLG